MQIKKEIDFIKSTALKCPADLVEIALLFNPKKDKNVVVIIKSITQFEAKRLEELGRNIQGYSIYAKDYSLHIQKVECY